MYTRQEVVLIEPGGNYRLAQIVTVRANASWEEKWKQRKNTEQPMEALTS
jgi:hypothetical protein